jgi:hypothetical protein
MTFNEAFNEVCISQDTLQAFNEACKKVGCNPKINFIIGLFAGMIFILIIIGVYLYMKKRK